MNQSSIKLLVSILITTMLVGSALFIHYNILLPCMPLFYEPDQEIVWDFPSMESSYCIDCHTNEAVIAASTYAQDLPTPENTGG